MRSLSPSLNDGALAGPLVLKLLHLRYTEVTCCLLLISIIRIDVERKTTRTIKLIASRISESIVFNFTPIINLLIQHHRSVCAGKHDEVKVKQQKKKTEK